MKQELRYVELCQKDVRTRLANDRRETKRQLKMQNQVKKKVALQEEERKSRVSEINESPSRRTSDFVIQPSLGELTTLHGERNETKRSRNFLPSISPMGRQNVGFGLTSSNTITTHPLKQHPMTSKNTESKKSFLSTKEYTKKQQSEIFMEQHFQSTSPRNMEQSEQHLYSSIYTKSTQRLKSSKRRGPKESQKSYDKLTKDSVTLYKKLE